MEKLFEGLVDAEKRQDVLDFIRLNYEFHFRLYEQSRSAELMQIIDNLWLKVSPILYHSQFNDRFKVSNESHKAIIEAISNQDIFNAKAALVQDISWSYEDLISALSRETSIQK